MKIDQIFLNGQNMNQPVLSLIKIIQKYFKYQKKFKWKPLNTKNYMSLGGNFNKIL